MVKFLKNCPKAVFDSSKEAFWCTESNAKDPSSLKRTVSEKNQEKPFLAFFKSCTLKRAGFFVLHSVHQEASFELSKTAFGQFFKIFTIRGGKHFRPGEDEVKNLKEKLCWNQHDKTNKEMGGRSLTDKFGLYDSPLQCSGPSFLYITMKATQYSLYSILTAVQCTYFPLKYTDSSAMYSILCAL